MGFKLSDLMHTAPQQRPKKKIRKTRVPVGSMPAEDKNTIRMLLASRLRLHQEYHREHGAVKASMSGRDLATWFVEFHGDRYPGYTVEIIMTVLLDANETGSIIRRVMKGRYTLNESFVAQAVSRMI